MMLNVIVPFRAGKTSIQQVLFKNLPPKETFYLETTMRIIKHRIEFVVRTFLSYFHLDPHFSQHCYPS
jgi:hypothetical protein